MNNQGAGNAPNPPNNFANFNAMAAANPVPQLNFGNAGQGLGQNPAQWNNLGLANMPGGPALGPQPAVGAVNLADMNDDQLINALFNTPYAAAAAAPIGERVLPGAAG